MDLPCASGDTLEIAVLGTAMHDKSATGEVGPTDSATRSTTAGTCPDCPTRTRSP